MKTKDIRGYCCIISGIIGYFLYGNAYTWGNIATLYYQFLKSENSSIEESQLLSLSPIAIFCFNCFPLPISIIARNVSIKTLNLLSAICLIGSHFMLYFAREYLTICLSFILIGLGIGFMFFNASKNAWNYFPKRTGLITGLFLGVFGLSPAFFTVLADYIIDPSNIQSSFLVFFRILIYIMTAGGILSFLLVFQYTEEHEEGNEILVNPSSNVTPVNSEPISMVFKDSKIYKIFFMILCYFFYGLLISTTYRKFGEKMGISQSALKILSPCYSILGAFARLFWGMMYDICGFFTSYIIITILQTVGSAAVYYTTFSTPLFCFTVLLSVIPFSGQPTLFPPLINQCFGKKNSGILVSVGGLGVATAAILGPLTYRLLVSPDSNSGFEKIYLLGTGLTIFAFILLWTIDNKPFKYESDVIEEFDSLLDENGINPRRISLQKLEE